jgi:hypothetical protein
MMLAIYLGRVFAIGDDLNACQLLDRATGELALTVDYSDPGLLVDPTDAQVEAAEADQPLPPESCAICHGNPLHDNEWRYRTQDGYGVCDDCGRQGKRNSNSG